MDTRERIDVATCSRCLVEGLEHVDRLGDDQVRQVQLASIGQVGRRSRRHVRWVARQVPDEDVRVDERAHRTAAARLARVERMTSSQAMLRFAAGTPMEPARDRNSGVREHGSVTFDAEHHVVALSEPERALVRPWGR
ncbi:MAG: hypothetical protein R2735_03625 [Microthrixaceae bacterium]